MTSPYVSHIVLAEDDPKQARLYSTILTGAFGLDVHLETFCDSEEAAAYLESHLVDLLITDLRMPKVDGVELIRRAKARYSGVQVLIMTAASTADSLVDAAELGATDYLLKPFEHELLIDLVAEAQRRLQRWRAALAGTLHR